MHYEENGREVTADCEYREPQELHSRSKKYLLVFNIEYMVKLWL